jgi:uncharacterized protein (TIGR02594 family)
MAVLKLNDRGIGVRQLQLLLNSKVRPSPKLKVDGQFGPQTNKVVVAFQTSQGLTADGAVGPRTRAALGLRAAPAPTPILPLTASSPLQIAAAELGVHENSSPGQHTTRILEYHQTTTLRATADETAWCSSFVNWVVQQSGGRGTNSAAAKSWLNWGASATTPRAGDIVVIKRKKGGFTSATGSTSGYHVGFYVSSTRTHIRILGGNQHDSVTYSNFSLSSYDVQGYRR